MREWTVVREEGVGKIYKENEIKLKREGQMKGCSLPIPFYPLPNMKVD